MTTTQPCYLWRGSFPIKLQHFLFWVRNFMAAVFALKEHLLYHLSYKSTSHEERRGNTHKALSQHCAAMCDWHFSDWLCVFNFILPVSSFYYVMINWCESATYGRLYDAEHWRTWVWHNSVRALFDPFTGNLDKDCTLWCNTMNRDSRF